MSHDTFHTSLRVHISALAPTRTSRDWPENKLAEAEVMFIGGVLNGQVLAGFTAWRRADGSNFVSGPNRQDEDPVGKVFNDVIIHALLQSWADWIEREYPAGDLSDDVDDNDATTAPA